MRLLFALVAGCVSAGLVRADKPAADTAATATDVVKSAIKAHGGAELLDKYKGGTMKMKGEISMMGIDLEFEGKVIYMQPDKFKMKIDTALMGQKLAIEQVMNGKKMKMTLNGMDVPVDDHTRDQLRSSITEEEIT